MVHNTFYYICKNVFWLNIPGPCKNKLAVSNEKTNFDRIIGMRGVVTEDIDDLVIGEVMVDGKKWSAISDSPIKKGEKVKIVKIEGVKLVVER